MLLYHPSNRKASEPWHISSRKCSASSCQAWPDCQQQFRRREHDMKFGRCIINPRYCVFRKYSRFLTTPNTFSTFARTDDFLLPLGLLYRCNKNAVTQIGKSPKMVFANNQEGEIEISHYHHLTIEEREKLYLMKGQGKSFREIARLLGRSPSTISREWQRNRPNRSAYGPSKAQRRYERKRKNCGRKHILCCPHKREVICRFIQEKHWFLEQIEHRFQIEGNSFQISYSSIYRAIHAGLFGPETRIRRNERFLIACAGKENGQTKKEKKTSQVNTINNT